MAVGDYAVASRGRAGLGSGRLSRMPGGQEGAILSARRSIDLVADPATRSVASGDGRRPRAAA